MTRADFQTPSPFVYRKGEAAVMGLEGGGRLSMLRAGLKRGVGKCILPDCHREAAPREGGGWRDGGGRQQQSGTERFSRRDTRCHA